MGERAEGFVEGYEVESGFGGQQSGFLKGNSCLIATALSGVVSTRVIHEVRPVALLNLLALARNPQVRLVHERRRLQRMIRALAGTGRTPQMYAVRHKQRATVGFLLQHGADASAKDNNSATALDLANQLDFYDIAAMLAK